MDGYRTLTANSGEEARRQLAAGVPDLILLDVLMHDVNGFDLCRKIKAAPASKVLDAMDEAQ